MKYEQFVAVRLRQIAIGLNLPEQIVIEGIPHRPCRVSDAIRDAQPPNVIDIAPDGTVRFVWSDDLIPLANAVGLADVRRASHVEPLPGTMAWTVDMSPSDGPRCLGTFPNRQDALNAERDWLTHGPIETPV